MADHRLYWDLFFESIADLLDEYEHNLDTGDTDIRESIAIRMEYAIVALQQVAFIASNPECLPFMQCLLRNVRVLMLHWTRKNGNNSRCTQIAIYEYEPPTIISSGAVGRPKVVLSRNLQLFSRNFRLPWQPIS